MNTVEVKKIWEKIKQELKKIVPASTFDPWISPLEAISFEDNQFTLISGESFGIEHVKRTQYKNILECFKKYFGKEILVNIEFNQEFADKIKKDKQKLAKKIQKEQQQQEEHQKAIDNLSYVQSLNINLRYRFDNFVADKNNKIAKAAAQKVAQNPTALYNPLYIQGASGLGKTHLMQAIGHYVTMNSSLKVQCIKTEDFINDYVNSTAFVPNKNTTTAMNKFRNKYRNVDILLIDDIQFIENKKKCIDELFNTFDTLYNANKQIVLTSDKLPKDLPEIPKRLRTRFEQGLIVEIQPPEFETRVQILKNLATEKGIENIPQEVFEYIAKYYDNNVRELEGAFTKVNAYSDIEETPITLSYAQKVLKCEENSTRPDIDNIVEKVSDFYNITNEDIKGTSRVQNISNARSVVCYIAREKLQYSYESIANALNKRHQTVMYSSDKIKKAVKNDKNLEKDVNKIIKSLSL
ncbi:chromosomal replication initiator protein DnaA [bacterium]|nr:chromosomal replication initiator protein DnaA [bacterium]